MKLQLISFFLILLLSLSARSEPIDVANDMHIAIGQHASFLEEGDTRLKLNEVIEAYATGKLTASKDPVMGFAIGSRPVWVRFEVANNGSTSVAKRLSIETSWLDKIDVYFLQGTRQLLHHTVGDTLPFSERPVDNRVFMLDHVFEPGLTSVYMRVETPDPLVLPIYLTSPELMHTMELQESYSYGMVYGVIFALLLYNLMLYFGLKSSRYLYYAIYLSLFLLANISYTGHGFKWLWPEYPSLQLWANPILMVAYGISGLLFATRFLDTQITLPHLHRLTIRGCWGFATALALAVLAQQHVLALLIAFSFVLLYSFTMVLLGALSLRAGNQSAKYFLYASIIAALSATVTALAVWGFIPYNTYTYRAVELGTMIEAILLALALADRFRMSQAEKASAEQMARIDSLTGLNNRRAFSELVEPTWQTGIRKKHAMALIMLDIDAFKSINDSLGHAEGDNVLVHAARMLAQSARAGDILARWGGEEFILFMTETSLEDAVVVAERIRESISSVPFDHDGHAVSFTASLGVANYSQANNSLKKLIATTDAYLYKAKALGRNQVCSPLSD